MNYVISPAERALSYTSEITSLFVTDRFILLHAVVIITSTQLI